MPASQALPFQTLYLNGLQKKNFWRLFVDGVKQKHMPGESVEEAWEVEHGHLAWATREPQGLHCMKKSAEWLFSEEVLHSPLTLSLINQLHQRSFPSKSLLLFSYHGTAPTTVRLYDEIERVTKNKEVVAYLNRRARDVQQNVNIPRKNSPSAPWKAGVNGITAQWKADEINDRVPVLLQNYEENLLQAKTEDEKIAWIVQLAQDIENIHMFADGNCRIMYLLLNKELMRTNCSPVILHDPNDFDFFTPSQMVEQVRHGQVAFQRFIETGYPYTDCISDQAITINIKKIGKIDVISRAHEANGLPKGTLFLGNQMLCEMVSYDFIENTKFIAQLTKFKNNFERVCDIWDKNVQETLQQVADRDSEKARWMNEVQRISPMYFKFFLQARNIASETETNTDFAALLKEFIESMKRTLASFQNDYEGTIRDPRLCHLTDTEARSLVAVGVQASGLGMFDKNDQDNLTQRQSNLEKGGDVVALAESRLSS